MTKRDIYGYLAITLAAIATAGLIWYLGYAPHYLRIAVSPPDSGMTRFLNALGRTFENQRSNVRLQVLPMQNRSNVDSALDKDKTDFAVVRADQPLPPGSLAVAAFQDFVVMTLAMPGSGIVNFSDIGDKRVVVIGSDGANTQLFTSLARLHRVELGTVKITTVPTPTEAADLAEKKQVDAIFAAAPRGSAGISRAYDLIAESVDHPPVFVPMSDFKSIANLNPALSRSEISAGEISASPRIPEKTVRTITFPALIVTRAKTRNNAVLEFTKNLFAVRLALAAQHPPAARLVALPTKRDAPFPLHPGAATYYDASEESLLDKYSDLLWLALFGFSGIVSVFVWFYRLAIPKSRMMLVAERNQLVELIRKARDSKVAQELDDIEREADELVVAVAAQLYDGTLPPEQQPPFDMLIARLSTVVESKRLSLSST